MSKVTLDNVAQRLSRLEGEVHDRNETQREMVKKLDSLAERFTRYEAKWGGIVMVLSAVVGLLLAFKTEILRVFRGG